MGVTSSPNDMCTLGDLKSYLGIVDVGQDAILQRLISASSDWIQSVLSRNLMSQAYVNDVYDGATNGVIIAHNYPVTSVQSLVINNLPAGQSGNALEGNIPFQQQDALFQALGYSNTNIDTLSNVITYGPNDVSFSGRQVYLTDKTQKFFLGKRNVMLSYTAGYVLTPTVGMPTLPFSLQQACIELASLRFREKDYVGKQTQTLAGQTVTYRQAGLPTSVMMVLSQYQNVVTN